MSIPPNRAPRSTDLVIAWEELRNRLKEDFGKKPDLQAVLFLIGVNVLGRSESSFTKEEKQDLMHVAVCEVLSFLGYYEFTGRDPDGWPHYKLLQTLPAVNLPEQEELLKGACLQYFEEIDYFRVSQKNK
jgi:hypothetical protein